MSRTRNTLRGLALALTLAAAAPLAAQSASGWTHFLAASESAAGGTTQSLTHRLTGVISSGVQAGRSTSTGYLLLGGFPAALATPATGRPWLTGALPTHGPLLGGTALALHGTELNLGPVPQITIGGATAIAGARTHSTLQTALPRQTKPGYRPVTVQNPLGSSTLAQGFGVLPLLEFPVAHQQNVPLGLRYRGTQGDQVVLVLALGTLPLPLALPPFHHGLELDLLTLYVLAPIDVTDPSGMLTVDLPPIALPYPLWFQALSLTRDPGWAPGSFTNAVRL